MGRRGRGGRVDYDAIEMLFMLKSVFIVGFTRFLCLTFGDNDVKMN